MPATIVPPQHSLWDVLGTAKPEYTLHVASLQIVVVIVRIAVFTRHTAKEVCWRQLSTIAHDNHLLDTAELLAKRDGAKLVYDMVEIPHDRS